MVMMPARMACTFMRVWRKAVTKPAPQPAKKASTRPSTGLPAAEKTADTALPSTKVPSVVRSAMSSTR